MVSAAYGRSARNRRSRGGWEPRKAIQFVHWVAHPEVRGSRLHDNGSHEEGLFASVPAGCRKDIGRLAWWRPLRVRCRYQRTAAGSGTSTFCLIATRCATAVSILSRPLFFAA
jgi:hypothetical protein